MSRPLLLLSVLLLWLGAACGTLDRPTAPGTAPTPTLARGIAVAYPPPTPPTLRTQADGTQVPYPAAELAALQAATPAPTLPRPTATAIPLITPTPGGRLLRDLWRAPADRAPVRYLYYSSAEWVQDHFEHAFWRVDLHDLGARQKIATIPNVWPDQFPVFATLSPDGQFIAYLVRLGDAAAELRVMRSDGSDDRLVARPVASVATRGNPRFVWSPDSTHLAFIKYWDEGQEFYVYNVQTGLSPRRIARVGGADLGVWQDDQHVLVYLVTAQDQPLQVMAINTVTNQQQVLARFPSYGLILDTYASPDHTKIYMSGNILDVATAQFTPVPVTSLSVAWGPNNHTLLEFLNPTTGGARLISIDPPTAPTVLRLLPPYRSVDMFDLQGVSPDGRYILIMRYDEDAHTEYLLYDVVSDQWKLFIDGLKQIWLIGWN